MGGKARDGRRITHDEACRVINDLNDNMFRKGFSAFDRNFIHMEAGSFRRLKKEIGDIDIVVISNDLPGLKTALASLLQEFSGGEKKFTGLFQGVQIDFVVSDALGYGAAMMHCTGPTELNVRQRAHAKRKGLLLNEKGLWKGDQRLPCSSSETAIYTELGLKWIEPENRG